jgi:hypothetical protein
MDDWDNGKWKLIDLVFNTYWESADTDGWRVKKWCESVEDVDGWKERLQL